MAKIINKMYGGQVEINFDTVMHRYSKNGKKVPGVTTVIGATIPKPSLIYWSANMASEYWKNTIKPDVGYSDIFLESTYEEARKAHTQNKVGAGNIGSDVHHWVEAYIKGQNPDMPDKEEFPIVFGAVEKFLGWVKEKKVRFLSSEQMCYSKKHGYCGIIDFFCYIDGKLWLGDLKTSNAIYPEMKIQTGAYWQARTEEFPDEKKMYSGIVIVRVGKDDGKIEVEYFTETQQYANAFNSCLQLYKRLQKLNIKTTDK